MKRVLTLSESAELELLKNVLEEGGIRCVFRNEQLAQTMPLTPFNTELWVLNDDDFPPAQALCHDWCNPKPEAGGIWDCPQCGQPLGRRFDNCWKCGAERIVANQLTPEGAIL